MKAIMVMYDSLNRHMLQPYGCNWVKTPNFTRLAEKSVRFNNNYVGSMPCMPARRELHTGRYNFLHRSWGPMEPFDFSMPECLKNNDIHSHIVSDHMHYWEDGGATYHTRYSSWEISRGQEGDFWKTDLGVQPVKTAFATEELGIKAFNKFFAHDEMNRQTINCEEKMPQAVTFANGIEFITKNHDKNNWFLQIETFDPHEPFFTQPEYKALYPDAYKGPRADWPGYDFVKQSEDVVSAAKNHYAALVTMCDTYLGKVLDKMDEYNLWEDTLLIVNTDHGYLLGEHGWWSKTAMPVYNEIARTPLFVYDPRSKVQNQVRQALTQTIDIPATILEFFNLPIPQQMQGKPLKKLIEENTPIRSYAMFGYHGAHVNICDGKNLYMRAPASLANTPLNEYTLMPTHMRGFFTKAELQNAQLVPGFGFCEGYPLLKTTATGDYIYLAANYGTKLFDIENDPGQLEELDNVQIEAEMAALMIRAMHENEAPKEQFQRLGLPQNPQDATQAHILKGRQQIAEEKAPVILTGYNWQAGTTAMYKSFMRHVPEDKKQPAAAHIEAALAAKAEKTIEAADILAAINPLLPAQSRNMVLYFVMLSGRVY